MFIQMFAFHSALQESESDLEDRRSLGSIKITIWQAFISDNKKLDHDLTIDKNTTPVDQKSESMAGKGMLATIKLEMGSVAEDSEKDAASHLIKHEKKDGIQQ